MNIQTAHALEILGYYALAYVITGIIGAVTLLALYYPVHRLTGEKWDSRDMWLAVIIGIMERILYTSAILIGQPAFIGVWVVLKAVGEWRQPKERSATGIGVAKEFVALQFGTALSIFVGVAAGYAIRALLPPIPQLAPLHLPLS